jgi:hypothetical protein
VLTLKPVRPTTVIGYMFLAILSFPGGVSAAQPVGKTEDAWRTLDPVVRATNRGVALMERYEYAQAVTAFAEAHKLAPDSAETRVNLAIAVYNRCAKGDLEEAEKLLDEVIRDDPNHARALYFRAITHQYRGHDEKAISHLQHLVKLVPHDACVWYLLARSKTHLGQPARAALERAIQENPGLASAYYDLMRIAYQEGEEDKAQALQETFVKLRQSPLAEMLVIPQYRQMGPLAVVRPVSGEPRRSVAGGETAAGPVKTVFAASTSTPLRGFDTKERATAAGAIRARHGVQLAMADVNGDGRLDLVTTAVVRDGCRGVTLLLGGVDGGFTDATETSGLAVAREAVSCAFGDYDNDNKVDLFISCAGPNSLLRGRGDGTFEDVTGKTGTGGPTVITVSAVFLDADHDGDLDIYVCNASTNDGTAPAANQLLNNNADGTFTDIADEAGVACRTRRSVMLAPADIDGDRDTDLVVFNEGSAATVFFNDRLGKYHEQQTTDQPVRGDHGGILQDFNGDGRPDLLVFPGSDAAGRLYLTDGTGALKPSTQFDGCIETVSTWGPVRATRVADVDIDGDLDIVVFGPAGHLLLNDGWGRFVNQPGMWPIPSDGTVIGTELADMTGDGVPDLLKVLDPGSGRIEMAATTLTPPANWMAVTVTGDRGDDKRTRSPSSGFGTKVELRCGLHSQVITYTGLGGGLSQSRQPVILGLSGASKADYLALTWPDGVTQCETELAANAHHRISEMERRVSSCPVLFSWNGERFEFIGDFAGVGGLGYYVAPGEYAPPQPLEHVKIEPEQLKERDGLYELRLCEAMEEVAYIDRLELLAVDHPAGLSVYPDERLAVTGPPPTHRLLCPASPIFPLRAVGPEGIECAAHLKEADRMYAYQPKLHPRFLGFCQPHALTLDFGDRLADLEPGRDVYLFLNGWIEYPYSQTTFAAAQAGVGWKPMKIERLADNDQWETIVPDAGAPGGMGRTIAIDLTDKLPDGGCTLRISTNLEIYIDQVFIAADRGTDGFAINTAPLLTADLRRLGFPKEYSPDGQHPTVYTYDFIERTSSFKMPKGAYTRYGPVDELLTEFDDRYVILGTGDEIAVSFDARGLPPLKEGDARSFILISHAYCKDMDLYTAEPDTVEPLPFQSMKAFPPAQGERYPDASEFRRWRQRFNTRLVD